eukprot:14289-Chlamydomonas_euryale.AAC.1
MNSSCRLPRLRRRHDGLRDPPPDFGPRPGEYGRGGGGGGYDGYEDAYGGFPGAYGAGMAGMSMVPMVLPGGQVAYVLAAPGAAIEPPPQPPPGRPTHASGGGMAGGGRDYGDRIEDRYGPSMARGGGRDAYGGGYAPP